MIPFNIPPCAEGAEEYIHQAIESRKICGDGPFTKRCDRLLEEVTGSGKVLLTTSGTSALELAALLTRVEPGDEVIMPSFTFSSTANAFALRGATVVFVDICPETMNLDVRCVEDAITPKTRVIVPVHYAGVCCDMDALRALAKKSGILLVEDAAQAVTSTYRGQQAGTMSDVGCFSFHETKNFSMGEGGAVLLNNPEYIERAEIIREKGTDRSRFYRGQVDKYSWVDIGSSLLPSELNAAYLLAQLERRDEITASRMARWQQYDAAFQPLKRSGAVELPVIPDGCGHNAHMYFLKAADLGERTRLIEYLKAHEVNAVFHYVPLHSAKAGRMFGRFHGEDRYTTRESERLLRLPLFYGMTEAQGAAVIDAVNAFYKG